ncbi:hypothetical protein UJ101_00557 [Flavobacteriaceae bacterium UJ101]|nr:hypothetical protein UJ101_00557 [Flavobacteriaceae bacterium UJ101]
MSILFTFYFLTFFTIYKKKKTLSYLFFTISTLISIGMFFYHTTSSLNLNF